MQPFHIGEPLQTVPAPGFISWSCHTSRWWHVNMALINGQLIEHLLAIHRLVGWPVGWSNMIQVDEMLQVHRNIHLNFNHSQPRLIQWTELFPVHQPGHHSNHGPFLCCASPPWKLWRCGATPLRRLEAMDLIINKRWCGLIDGKWLNLRWVVDEWLNLRWLMMWVVDGQYQQVGADYGWLMGRCLVNGQIHGSHHWLPWFSLETMKISRK